MNWGGPADIRAKLRRRWERGELLAARLGAQSSDAPPDESPATPLFPLTIPLKKPSSRDLAEDFAAVRHWVDELQAGSRETRGFGYRIEWQEVRHRVHGRNRLPARVVIPEEADALRLIGQLPAAERAERLAAETRARVPALGDWLVRQPLKLLAHADDWDRVLAVVEHLSAHPRPGIYRRELEIPGVDTKFIEARRGLLAELLDLALPESAIDRSATGARGFDRRFGLREEPALIRFRLLDRRLAIAGLTDLTVPVEQFATLNLPVERAFITENKTNGLAFPDVPDSIVIMALGYGLDRLAAIPWLPEDGLIYWGDIDTHGFAILNRLRRHFPATRSLLMDRATLEAHRRLWTREGTNQRFTGELDRLTDAEQALYDDLRHDRLGERVRLEQERIGFGWLKERLER
ncbi:MAG: hypothetical protein JXJ30_03575 [Halothiobacillaceae bacterium]|nr:hypothetical protein [Halothiobacillaceae bacterium]HER33985.1 hypothetical protein [Halothiobacillaceae bacterium]